MIKIHEQENLFHCYNRRLVLAQKWRRAVIANTIRTIRLTPMVLVLLAVLQNSARGEETAIPELACPGPSLAPMIQDPPDRS
jgi:hypothetical protein